MTRACLGPIAPVRVPRIAFPAGAWDTHFHVLGPQSRFPYAASRKYTPPDAPFDAALNLHDSLGIARGIVVHANTHGFDNAVDLDAVQRSDGRYFAVVRLDGSATREGCKALHARGARGVRFAFNPQHGGALDLAIFDQVLHCIDVLGWFVELHFDGNSVPTLHDWIASVPAKVVIDHMGRIDPAQGIDAPPFQALLDLARHDHVWVKLSGADRMTREGPPYADVVPFARALADTAPHRVLWGTDWPHTGVFDADRMPDDAMLADALAAFIPDEGARERALVDNPLRLLET